MLHTTHKVPTIPLPIVMYIVSNPAHAIVPDLIVAKRTY